MNIVVGYLGPEGTYSESACHGLYSPTVSAYAHWQFQRYPSLSALLADVAAEKITLAVVPAENSYSGLTKDDQAHEILATIAANQLLIQAEFFLPMQVLLLALPQAILTELAVVHVNLYAQAQCQNYLRQYPQWRIETHHSSAAAAQAVQTQQDRHQAAIASPNAAKKYGLTILDDTLFTPQTMPVMRFVAVSRQASAELYSTTGLVAHPISSFVLQTALPEDEIVAAMHNANIPLYLMRSSLTDPSQYYLDVRGKWAKEQLASYLPKGLIPQSLGVFPICTQSAAYVERFGRQK